MAGGAVGRWLLRARGVGRLPRASDGGDEAVAVGVGQAEGGDEEVHRLRARRVTRPALEVADAARTQPGPLGQCLLREAGRESETPEEITEARWLRGRHPTHPAARRFFVTARCAAQYRR